MTKKTQKGRAAQSNEVSRYDEWQREGFDDGWHQIDDDTLKTTLIPDASKSIIATNNSPDVPFEQSINPYRGCEHGCIYCYARPSHAWLGYSPGLDFESKILYKADSANLLRKAFEKKSYQCKVIALGSNTDAYQPVERNLEITRSLLRVFADYRHPVGVITKSSMIERDIDYLKALSEQSLVNVLISVTSLDKDLSRKMEPRAASPSRRLKIIEKLRENNINVGVLLAPVIPVLTDGEMEKILVAVKSAGAMFAGKVLLRLPGEIEPLFEQWLREVEPNQCDRVLNRLKECHEGQAYKSRFGSRMTGSGYYAEMIAKRFANACKKVDISQNAPDLDCSLFNPVTSNLQLSLF